MNLEQTLQTLEEMGTAQNRKIYARHGVGENMFGVSFANLNALKKQIEKDLGLARQLWDHGNHDARNLATMIVDPKQVDGNLLDRWVCDLNNYVITDSFVGMVALTPLAKEKAVAWISSEHEYIGRAGWHLLGHLAQKDDSLPDDFFLPYLDIIEKEIDQRPNRTREAMNNTLIAIGIRNPDLMGKAMAAAVRVGEVKVDHGDTSCKTNFSPEYIQRTVERKKSKGQWG